MTLRPIYENQLWRGSALKVKDAMTRMPFTISTEAPIPHARVKMRELGVRHLPVLERGELVGVVSERDVLLAETFHGPGYLLVGDAMKLDPLVIAPHAPLSVVLEKMIDRKVNAAVVAGARGNVIGIFTTVDALALLHGIIRMSERDLPAEDAGEAAAGEARAA